MKYEKSVGFNKHSIESNQVLCDEETGRVVAVFYNDYDMDDVLAQLNESEQVQYLKQQVKNLEYQLWESLS